MTMLEHGVSNEKERRSALLVLLLAGPGLHHCVNRFPLDVLALTERRIFLDVDQVLLVDVPFFQQVHGDQVRQCGLQHAPEVAQVL